MVNAEDVLLELAELCADERFVLESKGQSYNPNEPDRLSNFKRLGALTNTSPLTVWLIYFLKHVDSIRSIVQGGSDGGEPLRDRVIDLRNYALLGLLLYEDLKGKDYAGQESKTEIEGAKHPVSGLPLTRDWITEKPDGGTVLPTYLSSPCKLPPK